MDNIETCFSIKPTNIDGKKYLTIKQFARLTYHSESSIRMLISKGNRIRKIKTERIVGKPLIPITELKDYPFTFSGGNKDLHFFDYRELDLED